jgi:hypothetical protein
LLFIFLSLLASMGRLQDRSDEFFTDEAGQAGSSASSTKCSPERFPHVMQNRSARATCPLQVPALAFPLVDFGHQLIPRRPVSAGLPDGLVDFLGRNQHGHSALGSASSMHPDDKRGGSGIVWEIANDEDILVAKRKIKGFEATAQRAEQLINCRTPPGSPLFEQAFYAFIEVAGFH